MLKNLTISRIKQGIDAHLESLPVFNKATLSLLIDQKGDKLNYWTRRLVQTGELISIKRDQFVGRLFVAAIRGQPERMVQYQEFLAGAIRYPSYLSTEYVLAKMGALIEVPFAMTSVTVKSSRTFGNDFGNFIYQNIKLPLYCGYVERFFTDKRYFMATRAKAIFDFIYLRTLEKKFFEKEIEEGLRINWDVFEKSDIVELQEYAEKSEKKKMDKFVNLIIKRGFI